MANRARAPLQFSEMPTLGEFIRRAKELGVKLRHTDALAEGPKGPVRLYHLQRAEGRPFVVLPDLHQDRRLDEATVRNWCEVLGLPDEDFGLSRNLLGWQRLVAYGFEAMARCNRVHSV
jgi:hypothetical protein